MLLPVVLCGCAMLTTLGRPVSPAECRRMDQVFHAVGKDVDRAALGYCFLRGRVLGARIRPGMTESEVQQLLGPAELAMDTYESATALYLRLGLTVDYCRDFVIVRRPVRYGAVVEGVRYTPLSSWLA